MINSDLPFIPGQEAETLLLCQLQPTGVKALVRKGKLPRKLFGWFLILA